MIVGTSKKKAKHSAAESLLSLVEGAHIEPAAIQAQYVVNCLYVTVFVTIIVKGKGKACMLDILLLT